MRKPGLTNIQTPFSSPQALLDHPWQPQERPSGGANLRLESIAGEHPPAVTMLLLTRVSLVSRLQRSCSQVLPWRRQQPAYWRHVRLDVIAVRVSVLSATCCTIFRQHCSSTS